MSEQSRRRTTSQGNTRRPKTKKGRKGQAGHSLGAALMAQVENGRLGMALVSLVIVAAFVALLMLVSHVFATMPEPPKSPEGLDLSDPSDAPMLPTNLFGPVGYAVAHWCFDGLLGLGSFVVLGYGFVLCCAMIRLIRLDLLGRLRLAGYALFWAVWVATLSAWLFGRDEIRTWGGRIGERMAGFLIEQVHTPGLVAILLLSLFLVLLFFSNGFLSVVRTSGARGLGAWQAHWASQPDEAETQATGALSLGRLRMALGAVILVLALGASVATLSHLFTAGHDQRLIQGVGSAPSASVDNLLGPLGAYASDLLFNQYLGVGVLLQLAFFVLLGLVLLRLYRCGLYGLLRYFSLATFWGVWLAVLVAMIERLVDADSPLIWGGRQGNALAQTLLDSVHVLGTVLIVLVMGFLLLLLSSERFYHSIPGVGEQDESVEDESTEDAAEPAAEAAAAVPLAGEPDADDLPEPSEQSAAFAPAESDEPQPSEDATLQAASPASEPKRQTSGAEAFTIHVAMTTPTPPAPTEPPAVEPHAEAGVYQMPPLSLLREYESSNVGYDLDEVRANGQCILDTLAHFKIDVSEPTLTIGPTVTLYEVVPAPGVKLSRIAGLENDLAMALKSDGVRIIAPMPGAGTVGIEVPNSNPAIVSMRGVLESEAFAKAKRSMELPVGIGRTITNEPFVFDMAKMPHLLIAGATGQGKSVGLNALITSLLYCKHPDELKFVLIDPKMLEFSIYTAMERHFLTMREDSEKAIITDMSHVVPTLNSLCVEMDNRYAKLTEANVRNIKDYNTAIRRGELPGLPLMPYIVVIVDEFADLIMTSGKGVIQPPIARLAQKARAAGIHMVIATQRPSTDVITGLIKANFPARIAFKVFSAVDSRTILDSMGANKLIGRGDMLFYQGRDMERVQCAFMDTPETAAIVKHISEQPIPAETLLLPEVSGGDEHAGGGDRAFNPRDKDPLFDEVAELVVSTGVGSTSNIQRKYNIGYNRAGRLMDQLEGAGIVGPQAGSKPREVYIKDLAELAELLAQLR